MAFHRPRIMERRAQERRAPDERIRRHRGRAPQHEDGGIGSGLRVIYRTDPAQCGSAVRIEKAALGVIKRGMKADVREGRIADVNELETFRLLADEYLALDETGLAAAQAAGAIVEVKYDDQAVQK